MPACISLSRLLQCLSICLPHRSCRSCQSRRANGQTVSRTWRAFATSFSPCLNPLNTSTVCIIPLTSFSSTCEYDLFFWKYTLGIHWARRKVGTHCNVVLGFQFSHLVLKCWIALLFGLLCFSFLKYFFNAVKNDLEVSVSLSTVGLVEVPWKN